MKEVREFSPSFIFLSVLYVVVGLALLLIPSFSSDVFGIGLGVVLIVVGLTYGILFFIGNKREEGFLQIDLVIGIICVAFGAFILLRPGFLDMILPLAVAVMLLVGSVVKIQNAISMRHLMVRHWYLVLIGAIVIILLAVFLLFDPLHMTEEQRYWFIGGCLILDGLTNLISVICIRIRARKIKKIQQDNPGTDVQALYKSEWQKADEEKAQKKAKKRAEKRENKEPEEIVVEAKDVTGESEEKEDSKKADSAAVSQEDEEGGKVPELENPANKESAAEEHPVGEE